MIAYGVSRNGTELPNSEKSYHEMKVGKASRIENSECFEYSKSKKKLRKQIEITIS